MFFCPDDTIDCLAIRADRRSGGLDLGSELVLAFAFLLVGRAARTIPFVRDPKTLSKPSSALDDCDNMV